MNSVSHLHHQTPLLEPAPLPWWGHAIRLGLLGLGLLMCFSIYATGQVLWALACLALVMILAWVYSSRGHIAWRYLLPGVLGIAVFVAFPLLYTARIAFTNYSSAHLLSEAGARDYLLAQSTVDEQQLVQAQLRQTPQGLRLHLTAPSPEQVQVPASASAAVPTPLSTTEPARQWLSDPLPERPAAPGRVQAIRAQALPPGAQLPGQPLGLKEAVSFRDLLSRVRVRPETAGSAPDSTPGAQPLEWRYLSPSEFAARVPDWQAGPDDSLVRTQDGERFLPDREQGLFVSGKGEALQPGFTVDVGLAHFSRMFGDADFRGPFLSIFGWTCTFAALTVFFAASLGAVLAALLNWDALKGRAVYRTLLFLPYAVPAFISILVFKGLFNQNFGEINALLEWAVGVRPAWFADPLLARVMILIVNIWLGYPYFLILCTGLIKAIPADLYEASALAGASPFTNFFRITVPLILRPLSPLLVAVFAYNFNNFVVISLLTNGRPDYLSTKLPAGTTDILVSYTYRIAFLDSGQNYGLAAAISCIIFVLVGGMALLNLRLIRRNAASARR